MLKKFLSVFLVIVMLIISASSVISVNAAVTGDINGDGRVKAADYLLVKRYVLGTGSLTSSQSTRADIDNDGDVDCIDYVAVKRIALGKLVSSLNTVGIQPISYSKSYTTSAPAGGSGSNYNSDYIDEHGELTDGYISIAPDYRNSSLSGYDNSVDVIINLGSAGKNICKFELSYLNTADAGIYSPTSVSIYGGNSSNYCNTLLGSKTINNTVGTFINSAIIELTDTVNYSYIKFSITKNSSLGEWIFIDETIVYGIVDSVNSNYADPYGSDNLTDTDRANELANVTTGIGYNSSKGSTVVSKSCGYSINSSSFDSRCGNNSSYLTNGNGTGASYSSKNTWVGIGLSTAPSITLTLNNYNTVNDVCGFAVHCFNRPSASINLPPYVDISVSTNNYTYYTVGRVYAPNGDQENYSYSLFLDKLVKAKYVKFTFPASSGYLWVEEIEVYANRSASTSSTSTTGYLNSSSNLLGGASDIMLLYHNGGIVDEEMLLPYVAYVDENGNILDTMFDGFLFLPNTGLIKTPGSTPWGTNKAEDWFYLFDEMFTTGKNFDALNKTAERVKLLLGESELKLQVYVAIPHLDPSLSNFGDIDGDGISENVTTQNMRVYVTEYYATKIMEKFNSMNYANLELAGFYWYHEAIAGTDVNTAKAVNNSFNYLGYQLFWIPYYGASGYLNGYDFGFDAVCLQPNYAFYDYDKSHLGTASNYAKQKGYCIEMEIADGADVDQRYFQKYMDYLSGGVKYGYMNNSLHMYYQSFDVIGSASEYKNSRTRLIYDYTYDFIKGTLDITPDSVSAISFNANMNHSFSGNVNPQRSDMSIYKLSGSPSHGSLAFSEDGSFVYYPNKGFKGIDTFTYQIGNYLGWSAECSVTISVR